MNTTSSVSSEAAAPTTLSEPLRFMQEKSDLDGKSGVIRLTIPFLVPRAMMVFSSTGNTATTFSFLPRPRNSAAGVPELWVALSPTGISPTWVRSIRPASVTKTTSLLVVEANQFR